jgi:hypothetical protein
LLFQVGYPFFQRLNGQQQAIDKLLNADWGLGPIFGGNAGRWLADVHARYYIANRWALAIVDFGD